MKEKYTYIDILRVISMFFVIGLHTVADNLRINFFTCNWHFANIVSSFMTIAVPVFFMISGAMILSSEKTDDIGYTLKKRLPRILIPFIVWSVIAVVYFCIKEYRYDKIGPQYLNNASERLKNILSTPVTIHLWFVYALIPIYVLSPFIRKVVIAADKKMAGYFFAIWIIFSGVLPFAAEVFPPVRNIVTQNYSFNLNLYSGYLGYFVLGYYLHNTKKEYNKKTLLAIFLSGVIINIIMTAVYTSDRKEYFEGFKSYNGIISMMISSSFFLLIKECFKNKSESKTLTMFSSVSFSVYLMHNLIISFMNINYWIEPSDIYMTVLRFLTVSAVSIIISYILTSIKITSYIFTGNKYKSNKINRI